MASRTVGQVEMTAFFSFSSCYKLHRNLSFDFFVAKNLASRWIGKVVVVFDGKASKMRLWNSVSKYAWLQLC